MDPKEPRKVIETCLEALQEVNSVLKMIPTSVAEKVRLALSTATCFLECGNEPAGVSNEEEGKADEGRGSCGRGRRMCGEGTGATAMVGYPESSGKSCQSSAACLPQEILLHILRLVPRQRRPTILACCLVNKAWHQVATYLLWEVLDTDVDSLDAFLLLPGIKASNTRSLHLCSITNYAADDDSFEPISTIIAFPFSNLRALAMERVRFNVPDLAQIFDACPNIVALAVDSWVDITVDETPDEHAVSASLRAGFGRLQSFAIWEEDNLITRAEVPLISLAVSNFGASLRALNLVHLSLGLWYDALPLISCSPNLVQLRCRFTIKMADAIIKNCPRLRRIVMNNVTSGTVNYFIKASIKAGPARTIEGLLIEVLAGHHPVNWARLLAYFGNNLKLLDVEWRSCAGLATALTLRHSTGLRVLATNEELLEHEIWLLMGKCPSLEKIFVNSPHSKAFVEAARRKGVDVRPKFWRQESSVFIDQIAKQWIGLDDDE
ncbi:hypothetical protein HK104_001391 [Borealophlyctis nickersoniae]|nr:hypothetical protein HK104_001391 [Borealophlyctis nickersoniae]